MQALATSHGKPPQPHSYKTLLSIQETKPKNITQQGKSSVPYLQADSLNVSCSKRDREMAGMTRIADSPRPEIPWLWETRKLATTTAWRGDLWDSRLWRLTLGPWTTTCPHPLPPNNLLSQTSNSADWTGYLTRHWLCYFRCQCSPRFSLIAGSDLHLFLLTNYTLFHLLL